MNAFVPTSGRGLPKCTGLRRADGAVCVRPPNARGATAAVAPARVTPTAKIFDWKKREDPNYGEVGGDGIITLSNIRPAPGSRRKKKRKGRGHAAGQGGSCGFGMRGQKARSGRSVRPGFEGGQTPLYRRIPKFVGRPMGPGHKRTEYALIKISMLNQCEEGAQVDMAALQQAGIATRQKSKFLFKVVGGEELTVPNLVVRAHAFTGSAAEAIEAKGGQCILVSPTTGKDLVFDDDEAEDDDEVESGDDAATEEEEESSDDEVTA